MAPECISQIHHLFREFTINFANSLFFREFTMNSLSISRIHHLFREFIIYFANSLLISRIHYEFIISFANLPSFSPMLYLFREFIIYFANSLSILKIDYFFANIVWIFFFLRIFNKLTIVFANSQRIHYLFCKSTMNSLFISRIHHLFHEFTIFSRIYFELIIYFANSL